MSTDEKYWDIAFSAYTTGLPPDGWMDWEDETIYEWLMNNTWYELEHMEPATMFNLITDLHDYIEMTMED